MREKVMGLRGDVSHQRQRVCLDCRTDLNSGGYRLQELARAQRCNFYSRDPAEAALGA